MVSTSSPRMRETRMRYSNIPATTPRPEPTYKERMEAKSHRLAGDRRREALAMIAADSHEIVWMDRFLESYRVRRRANAGGEYTVDMARQTCTCPDCAATLTKHNREAREAGVDWDVLDKHTLWISYLLDREEQGHPLPMADDYPVPDHLPAPTNRCDGICLRLPYAYWCEDCKADYRPDRTWKGNQDTRRQGEFD